MNASGKTDLPTAITSARQFAAIGAGNAPKGATVLQVDGVSKAYAEAVALKSATFEVYEGEILAILGPSGSGKTTILRLIAGLEIPSGGRIRLRDRDITALTPQERRIGVMFQSFALFPHMSVYDNVMFGLKANKVGAAEREKRFQKYMDLVRLSPQKYASRFPSELSGGQQQRVALARALAVEPGILLLDEPFSSLDARIREDMRVELLSRLREAGMTAVLVTHDQTDAAYMGDRVVLMNDGGIVQTGSYSELYHAPRSRFVGQFIGESNWLPCTAVDPGADRQDGRRRFKAAGGIWDCALADQPVGDEGAGVIQIRRDAVNDVIVGASTATQASAANLLTGSVRNVNSTGSRGIIWMEVESAASVQPYYVTNAQALAIAEHLQGGAQPDGVTVTLAIDPALCRYFSDIDVAQERL